MEQVISVHADSATVVLDVLSGQVLRTVDPHSMNISGGHHYTLSPGLVSAIGSDAIVMQNKNSGKMLAWSWHDVRAHHPSSNVQPNHLSVTPFPSQGVFPSGFFFRFSFFFFFSDRDTENPP
jgi:hypothetical protein